jgi:hypothetical protein
LREIVAHALGGGDGSPVGLLSSTDATANSVTMIPRVTETILMKRSDYPGQPTLIAVNNSTK